MIDTAVQCLKLLKQLHDLKDKLDENWTFCHRLISRSDLFSNVLESFQKNETLITKTISSALSELQQLLDDIRAFTSKYVKKTVVAGIKRALLCNSLAQEIAALNQRLDRLAIDLSAASNIDFETRRRDDLEDFRNFFEFSIHSAIEDIQLNRENQEVNFSELREEIADNKNMLNSILEILNPLYSKLTEEESRVVESDSTRLYEITKNRFDEIKDQLNRLETMMTEKRRSDDEEQVRRSKLDSLDISNEGIEVTTISTGRGAFSDVFIGYYGLQTVAIKTMKLNKLSTSKKGGRGSVSNQSGSSIWTKVENEVLLMNYLGNNPSVVTLYGFIIENNQMKLVLEHAPHGSLMEFLCGREDDDDNDDEVGELNIPSILCICWLCDLAAALEYIHKKDVKHRDIKADNLLVFLDMRIKLGDFGLSKKHLANRDNSTTTMGTMVFTAPEIRFGEHSQFASDIFSFALTAVQIFTRSYPEVKDWCGQIRSSIQYLQSTDPLKSPTILEELLLDCAQYDYSFPPSHNYNTIRPKASELSRRMKKILHANDGDVRKDPKFLSSLNLDKRLKSSLVVKEKSLESTASTLSMTLNSQNVESIHVEDVKLLLPYKAATTIQRCFQAYMIRRKYQLMKKILCNIRNAIVKRDETDLTETIVQSQELPFGGEHVPIVKEAKALVLRIEEEHRIVEKLKKAMVSKDVESMASVLNEHANMKPAFYTPFLQQAVDLIARINCVKNLSAAIAVRDSKDLEEWISKAQDMKLSDCDELVQAIALKTRIELESELLVKLGNAITEEKLEDIEKYQSKCIEIGMNGDHPEIKAAQVAKDRIIARQSEQLECQEAKEAERREQLRVDAMDKLSEALMTKNVLLISAALESVDHLGIVDETVSSARIQLQKLRELQEQEEMTNQSSSKMEALNTNAESGLINSDSEMLNVSMKNGNELKFASDAMVALQKQTQMRNDLLNAIASKDRKVLVTAIDAAENMDFSSLELKQAKDMIRDMEAQRRRALAVVAEQNLELYDAAEEVRKKRQDIAKQAKYDIKYYPALRTPDDFARGATLNKSKIKEGFLVFQNYVIPKSLLDLNSKEANKLALQMHKNLLGCMGDMQSPSPEMLVQDILRKGYEYKPIRDEIYVQIIKQLAGNPRAESVKKGWQMMCMCVGTFPPSYEFENYLLHSILEKRDRGRGAVVDYARYCLRALEAILSNGDGSGFVPSIEEILAYKHRPPILANIFLVDGNVITEDLPITPDLNVGRILEMCIGWLDLCDPRINTLGMFVYDMGEIEDPKAGENPHDNAEYKDLIRTPRPLSNDHFMGDVIVLKQRQRRKFKFVLKKKIFLPQHRIRGDDIFYERLVYLQAEDEVIIQGNFPILDVNEVVELAAISMAVTFGETMGSTAEELVEAGVIDRIVPSWREVKNPEQWAALILPHRNSLIEREPEDIQERFLQICYKSTYYGTHWFYVHKVEAQPDQKIPQTMRKLPRDLILAFNSEGLHIFDTQRHRLTEYSYGYIIRWDGSSSQFSLTLADVSIPDYFEFSVITSQAADMDAILLDHVRAIMTEEEKIKPS